MVGAELRLPPGLLRAARRCPYDGRGAATGGRPVAWRHTDQGISESTVGRPTGCHSAPPRRR